MHLSTEWSYCGEMMSRLKMASSCWDAYPWALSWVFSCTMGTRSFSQTLIFQCISYKKNGYRLERRDLSRKKHTKGIQSLHHGNLNFVLTKVLLLFILLKNLIKTMHLIVDTYVRRVSCWWNAHLCANLIIYYVPGTIFSRRPPRGSLKCDRGVKHTFSKTHFIFLASFFILFFCLAKVLDSLQITAFGSRRAKLLASLGGSLEGRREPFCIEKTMLFAYFH